jgi:hypothetical protein
VEKRGRHGRWRRSCTRTARDRRRTGCSFVAQRAFSPRLAGAGRDRVACGANRSTVTPVFEQARLPVQRQHFAQARPQRCEAALQRPLDVTCRQVVEAAGSAGHAGRLSLHGFGDRPGRSARSTRSTTPARRGSARACGRASGRRASVARHPRRGAGAPSRAGRARWRCARDTALRVELDAPVRSLSCKRSTSPGVTTSSASCRHPAPGTAWPGGRPRPAAWRGRSASRRSARGPQWPSGASSWAARSAAAPSVRCPGRSSRPRPCCPRACSTPMVFFDRSAPAGEDVSACELTRRRPATGTRRRRTPPPPP